MYLLIFSICFAFILSIGFLHRYGNILRQHPLVTVSVVLAWSFSFLIVFTIPLDVTATVYRQCLAELNITTNSNWTECQKPWGMVSDDVFPNLWRIIYWTSQFLTWIIMPLMQSYLKAGDFSVQGKLRSALIDNAIYYGTYLFICGVLLIYIALKPGVYLDWQKLKAIASSASNTWGLFLLVLLLGYALVEVPRNLYNNSKPGFTLQHAYFKLSKLSSDKAEAEENAEDVLESLQSLNIIVPSHHELRPCVEEILKKVPTELMEKAKRNVRGEGGAGVPSEKALIRLHRQVIKALQVLQRTEALWSVQVNKILYLEDVEMNFLSSPPFRHELSSRSRPLCHPMLEWYWECVIKSPFMKIVAGGAAVLSVFVIWSEMTFFSSHPVLSIFAIILNFARHSYDFVTIELFSMLTLCYLCYCAYSTIFRIKFLNLYYLAPHHQTNEYSLIFSGMLLCRLTPPMCLNFLGLMHMDSHVIKERIMETWYTQIMGHMDVLGIIANGFNVYFPMVMLAFCTATWFSLGSRILNALGFQQFMVNDEISSELVQEGRDLMVREKRKRQRNETSSSKRRDIPPRELTTGGANFRGGLLRDGSGSNVGYNTNGNSEELSPDYSRSLSQEINARFGLSTADVGFRPDYNFDDDSTNARPRNIFDDV